MLLNRDSGQFMTPDKSQHSRRISEPPGKGLSSRPMCPSTTRLRGTTGTLVAPLRAPHRTLHPGLRLCLRGREGCGWQPRRGDSNPPSPGTAAAQDGGTVGISSANPATQCGWRPQSLVAVPGPGCDLWADILHSTSWEANGLWTHLCCEYCFGNLSKWQTPLYLSTFVYKMTGVNQLVLQAPPASKNRAEARTC